MVCMNLTEGRYDIPFGVHTLRFHLAHLVNIGAVQQMEHPYPDNNTTYRVPRPPKAVREARVFRLE